MALLGSKQHTTGDTKRWEIDYEDWLANGANIEEIDVVSSSTTCQVEDMLIDGPRIVFFLAGGEINERVNVTLTMTDNFGNIKHDTIAFTVVAP